MSMLDVATVRKDFPVLARKVHGEKDLVYLDSAATSQKPRAVIDAMTRFYERSNANVHRSIHELGEEATNLYVAAHEDAARFVGAASAEEIVFTKNCTEALNLVAYAWGLSNLRPGDEVVISLMEHHSVIVPFQQIAKRTGATLRVAPLTPTGELDLDALAGILNRRTRLVVITGMSNVLGTITPVREWTRMAHEVGALAAVDAAQSVPHSPTDVATLGCDFLAASGHKMLGPTGIGLLYGKRDVLAATPPFLYGGEMIRRVTHAETTWNDLPWKFEAGTPAIAEAVGLSAAIAYLGKIGLADVERHEADLTRYAFERLAEVPNLTIYGPPPKKRGGVVAFAFPDVHAHDLASLLDEDGVAIRAGHHCAQPLMEHLDVASTARASFYLYNTRADVDALVHALVKARKVFRV